MLLEAFNLFDRDGSGTISTSEFGTVIRGIGFNPTDEEIETAVKEFDLDRKFKMSIVFFYLTM